MKNLQTVDKIVNFPHKAFHEDNFGQANAHVSQFCRKRLHLREIVELHGRGKIQKHVSQIWTFV